MTTSCTWVNHISSGVFSRGSSAPDGIPEPSAMGVKVISPDQSSAYGTIANCSGIITDHDRYSTFQILGGCN